MARRKPTTKSKKRPPWTLADYATFAKERGGELLTAGPRSHVPKSHDKLHFRCKHGHEWTPHATGIKTQGYWCFRCARGGDQTWTIADYRKHARDYGGKLIDQRADDYRPLVTDRLTFICGAGHRWQTVASTVVRFGSWCRVCSRTADPWDAARYQAYAAERGGRLLSRHPAGVLEHKVVVRFRCNAGHTWDTIAGQIKSYGTWCRLCVHDAKRKSPDDLIALAAERGGALVAEGRNRQHPYTWRCSRGHTFDARPPEIQKGYWCPQCSASRSERLVRAYFEQIFDKPFPRVRPTWLRNSTGHVLELDGYCDELRLAFEHHGAQHYRDVAHFGNHTLRDIRTRDARKRRICRSRGVALIEIPELLAATPLDQLRDVILRECRAAGVVIPADAETRVINIGPVYANTRDDEALAELHRIAKERGGKCLADEYVGSDTHVGFECSCGYRWKARPADIRQGTWCKRCALEYTASRKRLTIDTMRALAAERGGECLSDRYVNSNTHLRWRCGECGNEWDAPPQAISRGTWCPPCGMAAGWARRRKRFGKSGGNKGTLKYTIADMRRLARERGGRCLSPKFMGVRERLEWRCGECGRTWMAAPSDVQKGRWCASCSRRRRWTRHHAALNR